MDLNVAYYRFNFIGVTNDYDVSDTDEIAYVNIYPKLNNLMNENYYYLDTCLINVVNDVNYSVSYFLMRFYEQINGIRI